MRIWPISSISWKGLHPVTKIKSLGKSAGCNSWKSGNLCCFRSKSSLSINLVKLYEISATCEKFLIDSDWSSEMTILSLDMTFFRFWLGSIFFESNYEPNQLYRFFNNCRASRPTLSIFAFIFCSPGSLNTYGATQNSIFPNNEIFFTSN